jgi:hypothetical protein
MGNTVVWLKSPAIQLLDFQEDRREIKLEEIK